MAHDGGGGGVSVYTLLVTGIYIYIVRQKKKIKTSATMIALVFQKIIY